VDVFSGSLFVYQFLFVNTITWEQLNAGWWNLAVTCIVQKCHGHREQKSKKCSILFGSRPLGRGPSAAFFREPSFGALLRPWENQRMLSSFRFVLLRPTSVSEARWHRVCNRTLCV